MNIFRPLALLSLSFFSFTALGATACQYLPEATPVLKWTGFKFTEKSAVSGTFTEMTLVKTNNKRRYVGLSGMLMSHHLSINTLSVDAGLPARNTNLVAGLFKTFSDTTMRARISKVDKKTAQMVLAWGGKDYTLPLDLKDDGKSVTLTGKMDFLKMGLKEAYNSIHAQCKDVHTGSDGVAKTWSEVELSFVQNYRCN
jgi:hypothetical protein